MNKDILLPDQWIMGKNAQLAWILKTLLLWNSSVIPFNDNISRGITRKREGTKLLLSGVELLEPSSSPLAL